MDDTSVSNVHGPVLVCSSEDLYQVPDLWFLIILTQLDTVREYFSEKKIQIAICNYKLQMHKFLDISTPYQSGCHDRSRPVRSWLDGTGGFFFFLLNCVPFSV